MERSLSFYMTLVIFPGVLITFLSFFVFMADTDSADALGYGIGVIVVNLLSTCSQTSCSWVSCLNAAS